MAEAPFDPGRILAVLDQHDVEYVLVGGLGARAHGALRPTSDIDCVPEGGLVNLGRLADALGELGARLRVGGMTDDEARQLPVQLDAETLRSFGSSGTSRTTRHHLKIRAKPTTTTPRRSRAVHPIITHTTPLIIAAKNPPACDSVPAKSVAWLGLKGTA